MNEIGADIQPVESGPDMVLLSTAMGKVAFAYDAARATHRVPRTGAPFEMVLSRLFLDIKPDRELDPIDNVVQSMRQSGHWLNDIEQRYVATAFREASKLIQNITEILQLQRVLGKLRSASEIPLHKDVYRQLAQFHQKLAQAYYLAARLPPGHKERLYIEACSDIFISLAERGLSPRLLEIFSGARAQASLMNLLEDKTHDTPEGKPRFTVIVIDPENPDEIEATDMKGVDLFVVDTTSTQLFLISAKGDYHGTRPEIEELTFDQEKHTPAGKIALAALESYPPNIRQQLARSPKLLKITMPTGPQMVQYGSIHPLYREEFSTIVRNGLTNSTTEQHGTNNRRAA